MSLLFQVDELTLQALWTSLQPEYVDAGSDRLPGVVAAVPRRRVLPWRVEVVDEDTYRLTGDVVHGQ